MADQYLREKIVKDTECLEDIFTDTNSIEHNRIFNQYTGGTLVDMYHGDMQDDKMPEQQIKGVSASTNKNCWQVGP